MRWARYLVAIVLLLLIESALPPVVRPFGAAPDLLLGLALALAVDAKSWRAFGPIWGVGLARDLSSFGPFGLYAFLFGGFGIVIYLLREAIFVEHTLTVMVLGLVIGTGVGLGAWAHLVLSDAAPAIGFVMGRVVLGALLTSVCAGAFVSMMRRTHWLSGFVLARRRRR